jgi:signal transduction histidine kinase
MAVHSVVNDLQASPPRNPEEEMRLLADKLRTFTSADWVWIWIKNPHIDPKHNQWELRTIAAKGERSQYAPKKTSPTYTLSVTEYALRMQKPVRVTGDFASWCQIHDGEAFRVACREDLEKMGCKAFIVVPFQIMIYEGNGNQPTTIDASICIHYSEVAHMTGLPNDDLDLLGRITGHRIAAAISALQNTTLRKLNDLAHKHLTDANSIPIIVRQRYLMDVIALITSTLDILTVSIFFQQEPYSYKAACLATTGIAQFTGDRSNCVRIPEERWETITYSPEQGKTGECLRTGKPIVMTRSNAQHHKPRFVEVHNGEVVGTIEDALIPIPRAKAPPHEKHDIALPAPTVAQGVIRCGDHQSSAVTTDLRSFDPVDLQTLEFIAEQIAPAIELLNARITRERTISIVKHDLQTPISMIAETVNQFTNLASGDPINPKEYRLKVPYFDLLDLGVCALFAKNLTSQLALEPQLQSRYSPKRTMLEREVIVRLKKMLGHYAMRQNHMLISFNGFETVPPIYVDLDLIERVFVNLLINAIKYGKSGSEITVSAKTTDVEMLIDFINEGDGIEPSEQELIFDRGYRSPRAQHKSIGLGLGLYISRTAIARHGGQLLLAHCRDPTIFRVVLPSILKRAPHP